MDWRKNKIFKKKNKKILVSLMCYCKFSAATFNVEPAETNYCRKSEPYSSIDNMFGICNFYGRM